MKFIFGFEPPDEPLNYLVTFLIDVATITFFAAAVFKFMKIKGRGIKKFVKSFK